MRQLKDMLSRRADVSGCEGMVTATHLAALLDGQAPERPDLPVHVPRLPTGERSGLGLGLGLGE